MLLVPVMNEASSLGEYQLEDMKDDVRLMVANAYLQILFNVEILDVQKSHFW